MKKVLLWVLTVFFVLAALVYMPSFASVLLAALAVFVAPIKVIKNAIRSKIPKALHITIAVVVFFIAVFISPANTNTDPAQTTEPPSTTVIEEVIKQDKADTTEDNKIAETQPEAAENSTNTSESKETETDKLEDTTSETDNSETTTPETTTESEPETTQPQEPEIPENSTFEVHFIDVGQADAALVICDGKAMLIDGGNKGDSSLMYSYLKEHNIKHLDYIIATHAHEDHIGGIPGALNFATVDTVYCPTTSHDTDVFSDFAKYVSKAGSSITIPSAGDSFKLGSSIVDILACNAGSDINDTSIVCKITYQDTSFLFTGDAERAAEQAILNKDYDLSATVLKVGHHGSENSTTYPFLREIMPQIAVISVGEDNSYGHPTEATLSCLRDADVKVYRTDVQGHIVCVSDGKTVSVSVKKNADADTLASMATVERLQEIVRKSVDKYNGQSNKKLAGKLTFTIVSKTETQLTYTVANPIYADEEHLLDEAMDEILDFVLADVTASSYPEEVYAEITINYDIYDEEKPTVVTPSTEPQGTDYIGNKNTKKFHYSWCSSVNKMKESNKYYYTGTRDGMISKGYQPCKNCNP